MMITPASPEHFKFIVDSQVSMAQETENYQLDRAIVSEGVRAVLSNLQLGQYYIYEDNNSPIACLLTISEWSDWRNSKCLWIHSLYVEPEYRNKGIFKQMYQYLQNTVNSSNEYFGIRLYVDKTNTKAINVYNNLGMSNEHYSLFEWTK